MTENSTFTEELLNCCARGMLDKLKALMRRGASPEVCNQRGHSLLQIALRHGHWDIARYLHQHHPQLAQHNARQLPCLLAACQNKKDDPQGLELCVSQFGDSVDCVDKHGRSALLTACLQGHLKKTKWLLARGADVNLSDHSGRTALMEATDANHVSLVRALLKAGADPNAQDKQGDTALLGAVRQKKPNLTVIKMLLSNGADPERRNQQRVSPWLLAKQKRPAALELIEKHINNRRQIELPLFDNPPAENRPLKPAHACPEQAETDTDQQASTENQPQNTPAESQPPGSRRQPPPVAALKNRMSHGLPDWFAAARSGNLGKLHRLLLTGVDINATDQQGCTALIRAAGAGRRAVVAFLLQRGADFHHRSNNGSTALSAAILASQRDITRLLLKEGAPASSNGPADMPLVLLAAAQWSEDQLLALQEYGADLSVSDGQKRSALHTAALACESQHNLPAGKATFQFLLSQQLDLTQADSAGHTPLEILCGAHKTGQYAARDSHVATLLHSILQLPASSGVLPMLMPKLLASCKRHGLTNARGVLLAGGT